MAFNLGSSGFGSSLASSGNAQAQAGPDLEEIQTEALGFLAINGDAKLRFLPQPWPANALPPPTSNLLSIASSRGLVAAASPEALVVATTESVRLAFTSGEDVHKNLKGFTPQATIPVPRISQVTFTPDESFLVVSAETGGGLAVYDVSSILEGSKDPAFQLATNGTAVRALVPNPAVENASFVAVVLTSGQLLIANLKERQLVGGQSGPVMKEGVSCVSWSNKGKQLVAGLGSGTAFQMTPDGTGKAEIPRPPQLQGEYHVSAISWLANDTFLVVYTPTNFEGDHAPDSQYFLVNRQPKTTNYMFQKLQDPCPPFGMNRSPPHHFIARLREHPPNLHDAIIISSTAAGDIGLVTSSAVPLSSATPADKITGIYTTTAMAEDQRRAQLPVTEEMTDTSPIGVALDLSAKENVKRPIPAQGDLEATLTPLPALMALNHEGVLSAWWFVYNEAVRQGTAYPGLVAVGGGRQVQPSVQAQPQPQPQQQTASSLFSGQSRPSFGQPAFGNPTSSSAPFGGAGTFGKPAAPAFGSASTPGAFGGGAVFGGPSALGTNRSPWASGQSNTNAFQTGGPAFGKPAFGSITAAGQTAGSAFGSVSGLGTNASPWAAAVQNQNQGGAQAPKPANPFGGHASPASPFASFAGNTSGFASALSNHKVSDGDIAMASPASLSFTTVMGGMTPTTPAFGGAFDGGSGSLNNPGQRSFGQPSLEPTLAMGNTNNSFGAPATVGSEQSPFGALGNNNVFSGFGGKPVSSVAQSKDEEMDEGDGKAEEKKRALLAASGQAQTQATASISKRRAEEEVSKEGPSKPSGLYGTGSGGFKLGSTFRPDKRANDDHAKVAEAGSPVSVGMFSNALKESGQREPIKVKEEPKTPGEESMKQLYLTPPTQQKPFQDSTTPQEPPQASSTTPLTESTTPQIAPPTVGDFQATTKQSPFSPSTKPAEGDKKQESRAESSAPLPPSPGKTESQAREFSPAGSPPVDLGAEESSPLSSPAESVESEALDDAPLPPDFLAPAPKKAAQQAEAPTQGKRRPEDDAPLPPDFTKLPSRAPPAPESTRSLPSLPKPVGSPAHESPPKAGATPAFLRQAPVFAPPSRAPELPRSPSPVRPASARPGAAPLVRPASRTSRASSRPSSTVNVPSLTALPPPPPPQEKPKVEEIDLVDDEHDRILLELSQPPGRSRKLDFFIAHQDYVSVEATKPGIPGQIERVYRDINSMIDTLGLNARSLESFIKGHSELGKDGGRTRDDLDDGEDWCLVEVEDLAIINSELEKDLDSGALQSVEETTDMVKALQKEIQHMRSKHGHLKRAIDARSDPSNLKLVRSAPLSPELSSLQADLRREYASIQRQLAEVEEAVTLLRTKLSSSRIGGKRGGDGQATQQQQQQQQQQPTVEAVVNTIVKMTAMIERRSGDVDVLEGRLRRLALGNLDGDEDVPNGGLPPGTSPSPSPRRSRAGANLRSSMLSRSSVVEGAVASTAAAARSTTPGVPTPAQVERTRAKMARRRFVLGELRARILKGGDAEGEGGAAVAVKQETE